MENRTWRRLAILLLCIMFFILGTFVGYSKGTYDGAKFAIGVGMHFINIDFNQDELVRLIELYRQACTGSTHADCLEDLI